MSDIQRPFIQINLPSVTAMLLVLFIALKLTNVIAWSWWWVLSPLWLPWVLFGLAWLIVWVLAALMFGRFNSHRKKGF